MDKLLENRNVDIKIKDKERHRDFGHFVFNTYVEPKDMILETVQAVTSTNTFVILKQLIDHNVRDSKCRNFIDNVAKFVI